MNRENVSRTWGSPSTIRNQNSSCRSSGTLRNVSMYASASRLSSQLLDILATPMIIPSMVAKITPSTDALTVFRSATPSAYRYEFDGSYWITVSPMGICAARSMKSNPKGISRSFISRVTLSKKNDTTDTTKIADIICSTH